MATSSPQTVLVVDDENMVAEMLARYLKREGFASVVATDADEAYSVLRRTVIHVVLLDIRLGDVDGFEVLKKIREEHPSLPVIMLTGMGYDDKAMEESLQLGARGYLSKSADVSEIGVTIRRILAPA